MNQHRKTSFLPLPASFTPTESASGVRPPKAAKLANTKESNKFAEKTRKKRRARRAKAAAEDPKVTENISWLKKARKEKVISFSDKLLRRNGSGPILVTQMMIKLRSLEEENFKGQKSMCFDKDDKCAVKHVQCKDMTWETVVNQTHAYFCAE